MNRRPTLLAAITLTAAAALTLSACGGGESDSSKDNDKIAGADTGSEESASPSESTTESAERPKMELPSDLKYTFEWSKTGDKDNDAILSDAEQSIKAVDVAIANQDPLDKAYLFYYEGEAAFATEQFVQNYVDEKARTTGAYRYYEPVLKVADDGTASFSYCEDQGKAYAKYLKTNKVAKTKVTLPCHTHRCRTLARTARHRGHALPVGDGKVGDTRGSVRVSQTFPSFRKCAGTVGSSGFVSARPGEGGLL